VRSHLEKKHVRRKRSKSAIITTQG